MTPWRTDEFDYTLPEELIAQRPPAERDGSRLLVVDKAGSSHEHQQFRALPSFLRRGDVLVRNDTRVLPARLRGHKADTRGRVELLLLSREGQDTWTALVRPGRRLGPGTILVFGDGLLTAQVLERTADGGRRVKFKAAIGSPDEAIQKLGLAPIPPYIKEYPKDEERYQTVYSKEAGSAAAPTAGLHFTDETLGELAALGVQIVDVTLHVGLDTFRPVQAEFIRDHEMHSEAFHVPEQTAVTINEAKSEGRRIVAVGTTTARALEAAGEAGAGAVRPGSGRTDIFIYPGYEWQIVDGLLTNFHLPRSSLIMMVCALIGRERTLALYEEAVGERYRFYSFGDAMLIL